MTQYTISLFHLLVYPWQIYSQTHNEISYGKYLCTFEIFWPCAGNGKDLLGKCNGQNFVHCIKCFGLINNKILVNQVWDVNYGKRTGIMLQFRSWTWRQHLLTAQSLRTLQFARKVHQWKLFRLLRRTSIAICWFHNRREPI